MNDHRRFPGDRQAEQNSAYDLVRHLIKTAFIAVVHAVNAVFM
jgi:hypothetical protein